MIEDNINKTFYNMFCNALTKLLDDFTKDGICVKRTELKYVFDLFMITAFKNGFYDRDEEKSYMELHDKSRKDKRVRIVTEYYPNSDSCGIDELIIDKKTDEIIEKHGIGVYPGKINPKDTWDIYCFSHGYSGFDPSVEYPTEEEYINTALDNMGNNIKKIESYSKKTDESTPEEIIGFSEHKTHATKKKRIEPVIIKKKTR